MAVYTGLPFIIDDVSIGATNANHLHSVTISDDVAESVKFWVDQAESDDKIMYFTIYKREMPCGQIFLHDIDEVINEALIGYHLYDENWRGRGIGSKALTLLKEYALHHTSLQRLIIITSKDNLASQRLAEKCGFQFMGGAWEDPDNLLVFKWQLRR